MTADVLSVLLWALCAHCLRVLTIPMETTACIRTVEDIVRAVGERSSDSETYYLHERANRADFSSF